MDKYRVVGYINCDVIATGFLIPVYQLCTELFFHKLSEDSRSIILFDPLREDYWSIKNFVPITDGPEKSVTCSSFFVFKYHGELIYGSYYDREFREKLKVAKETLTFGFVRKEIEEIF